MIFSKEELVRYNRQIMLPEIGIKGQEKLKNSRVLVIGAGGLGCPALQYLSAAGIGNIGIIDFDTIELHNLHRQILYSAEDVGKQKAWTASAKIKKLNPYINTEVFDQALNESNAEEIISKFDLVIDGCDNFATRYIVNDTCVALKKPLVYGSILKFEGQLAVFNYNKSKNLRDLYPESPDPEDVPNCSETGVIGVVPGIIGTIMCSLTIEIILGNFKNENTLQLFNLKDYSMRKLKF
jgi:molybdopterin/thiamine biosynthesis adenylyltransferase